MKWLILGLEGCSVFVAHAYVLWWVIRRCTQISSTMYTSLGAWIKKNGNQPNWAICSSVSTGRSQEAPLKKAQIPIGSDQQKKKTKIRLEEYVRSCIPWSIPKTNRYSQGSALTPRVTHSSQASLGLSQIKACLPTNRVQWAPIAAMVHTQYIIKT